MDQTKNKVRDGFSSRIGVIAAAAGSAVGLGNIWMFPYIAGKNGGAAFIFIYILCILLIGLPIMLSEFVLGRRGQKNMVGSLKQLAPKTPWHLGGWFCITACFLILSFYGIVAGWSMSYVVKSLTNVFADVSPRGIQAIFNNHTSHILLPIFWHLFFLGLTAWIVISGIKKGIETFTKIFMPILFLIVIILALRAITLPGASKGLEFLFKADWHRITPQTILIALGTASFSLGIGNGVMVTYGSYINKKTNLGATALHVSFADTAVAILAGMAIFPAVFAFGLNPDSGPGLVFITLPNIFQNIPGGYFFQIIFFSLLTIAALTSSIATMEVIVAFFTEELKINRKKAAIISAIAIGILGIPCSLAHGVMSKVLIFGKSYFYFIVWVVEAIFLPVGGLLVLVFVGWQLTKSDVHNELKQQGVKAGYSSLFVMLIKFFVPLAIVIIFLTGLGLLNF